MFMSRHRHSESEISSYMGQEELNSNRETDRLIDRLTDRRTDGRTDR